MPVYATILISSQEAAGDRQYDVLQLILMSAYNLPFVLVSSIAIVFSLIFKDRAQLKYAEVAAIVSIVISIGGCLLMLWWALSTIQS